MIVPPQRRLSTDHAGGLPGGELLTSPSRRQADEGEGVRLADSAEVSDRLPLNHANSTVVDEATGAGLRLSWSITPISITAKAPGNRGRHRTSAAWR